jgi:hypothetical protein
MDEFEDEKDPLVTDDLDDEDDKEEEEETEDE